MYCKELPHKEKTSMPPLKRIQRTVQRLVREITGGRLALELSVFEIGLHNALVKLLDLQQELQTMETNNPRSSPTNIHAKKEGIERQQQLLLKKITNSTTNDWAKVTLGAKGLAPASNDLNILSLALQAQANQDILKALAGYQCGCNVWSKDKNGRLLIELAIRDFASPPEAILLLLDLMKKNPELITEQNNQKSMQKAVSYTLARTDISVDNKQKIFEKMFALGVNITQANMVPFAANSRQYQYRHLQRKNHSANQQLLRAFALENDTLIQEALRLSTTIEN